MKKTILGILLPLLFAASAFAQAPKFVITDASGALVGLSTTLFADNTNTLIPVIEPYYVTRDAGAADSLQLTNKLSLMSEALTISSGVVESSGSFLIIDTEAAAASDNLDTINHNPSPVDGTLLIIRAAADARTVVIRNGTGNILTTTAGDISLDDIEDMAMGIWDDTASKWYIGHIGGGGDALTSSSLAQFAATTSAEMLALLSDETGTGLAVFNDTPTINTASLVSAVATPQLVVSSNAVSSIGLIPEVAGFRLSNLMDPTGFLRFTGTNASIAAAGLMNPQAYSFQFDPVSNGGQFSLYATGMYLDPGASENAFVIDGGALKLAGVLELTPESLTISAGAVSTIRSSIIVDTESAAASDDLDTISHTNPSYAGDAVSGTIVIVRPASGARTVVLKDGTGNMELQGGLDVTLDDAEDVALLVYSAADSKWHGGLLGGSGAFSDAADPIVMNTTTKDVAIGAALINSAKLSIDGDADQVQLAIQGHSTQTSNPIELENSAGTVVMSVSGSGTVTATALDVSDGTIELKAAGATTLASPSAGVLTIEGNANVQTGTLATGSYLSGTYPNPNVILSDVATTANAGDSATAFFSSGTLEDARLSSNVPLKDAANAFTGNNTHDGTENFNTITVTNTGTFLGAVDVAGQITKTGTLEIAPTSALTLLPTGDQVYIGGATSTEAQKLYIYDGNSDNNPGQLVLANDAGSLFYLWTDTAGNLRFHTAAPTDDDTNGTDISGGGDIDAVTAGSGLTGGGTTGSVTVNVGAGSGITVNADDVAISTGGVTSAHIADGAIVNADINAAAAIDASKIGGGGVSTTEYNYLATVTSDVQTQIDTKIDGALTATRIPFATDANTLTDAAGMTYASSVLTVPEIAVNGNVTITNYNATKTHAVDGIIIDNSSDAHYGTNLLGPFRYQAAFIGATDGGIYLEGVDSDGSHATELKFASRDAGVATNFVYWDTKTTAGGRGWEIATGKEETVALVETQVLAGNANNSMLIAKPAGALEWYATAPYLEMRDTDAAANNRRLWISNANADGSFSVVFVNDAGSSFFTPFYINRGTGTNVTDMNFRADSYAFSGGTVTAQNINANSITTTTNVYIGILAGVEFEGDTADTWETTILALDPTSDRTIYLPDADGVVAMVTDINVIPIKSSAVAYTVGTTDAAELKGGLVLVTAAATITGPANGTMTTGMNWTIKANVAGAVVFDPNIAHTITLDGVALAAGDSVTSTSTLGDILVCVATSDTTIDCTSDGWTDTN